MKGEIKIEATEKGLHLTGSMFFKVEAERYEIIRALSRSLGIDSPEKWAALVFHCLSLLDDDTCVLEHTEIKIPIVKENNSETDAH